MEQDKLFVVNFKTEMDDEQMQERLSLVMQLLHNYMECKESVKVIGLEGEAEQAIRKTLEHITYNK